MKRQKASKVAWHKQEFAVNWKSPYEIFNAVADALCTAVTFGIQKSGKAGITVSEALTDVIYDVIGSAPEPVDGLRENSKSVVLAVLHAGQVMDMNPTEMLGIVADAFIKRTAALGGDVEAVTQGLVAGAIEGAVELGFDAGMVASQAAMAAVKAAYGTSMETGDKVLDVLAEPIEGAIVVLKKTASGVDKENPNGNDIQEAFWEHERKLP